MNLQANTLLQGGKYKIVRFISSGGFGCTYEAVHTLLDSHVAIKEFFVKDFCNRDGATNQMTVGTQSKVQLVTKLKKKFVDEAKAIFHMQHPGIVRVIDIFEENGTAYYVMDYIEGESLHELVKRKGALSEEEAVGYVMQVADALGYVHACNRLHLDIKPGNIMVDKEGKAVLIDFGASKQYDEVNGENTSTLLGKTPGYAPLEQMGNDVVRFTPATDIYALGATLYKLLTGKTPPGANLLASGEELEPLPVAVSSPVRKAVDKAMQLQRGNRYQTVLELKQALLPDSPDEEMTRMEERIRVGEKADEVFFSFCESPYPGYPSFSVAFTPSSVHVKAYRQGSLVKEVNSPFSKEQFGGLVARINSLELYETNKIDDGGLCGGENMILQVKSNGLVSTDVYHYGTKTNRFGTLAGDVYALLAVIKAFIPGYENLWTDFRDEDEKETIRKDVATDRRWVKKAGWVSGGIIVLLLIIWGTGNWSGNRPTPEVDVQDRLEEDSLVERIAPATEKHASVDLGLSVKWAACNIGASSPSDYGDYFAWGEISPKAEYTSENSSTKGMDMHEDISGDSRYDAALANWGGNWRLPTRAEIKELVSQCQWTWEPQDGHNGYRVTGRNGNSIFLPYVGHRYKAWLYRTEDKYEYSLYWSAEPTANDADCAYSLQFNASRYEVSTHFRCWGGGIRPVCD